MLTVLPVGATGASRWAAEAFGWELALRAGLDPFPGFVVEGRGAPDSHVDGLLLGQVASDRCNQLARGDVGEVLVDDRVRFD